MNILKYMRQNHCFLKSIHHFVYRVSTMLPWLTGTLLWKLEKKCIYENRNTIFIKKNCSHRLTLCDRKRRVNGFQLLSLNLLALAVEMVLTPSVDTRGKPTSYFLVPKLCWCALNPNKIKSKLNSQISIASFN
jgi:hypothetical protein